MTGMGKSAAPGPRGSASHWRWGFWILLLGAVLLLSPFRLVRVVGLSMLPTLRPGEALLVDRWYYRLTGVFRNDLVVMRHGDEFWIKRVVGLPGDQIALVYGPDGTIDGVLNLHSGLTPPPGARFITVPPGCLFILGDNMAISQDSRVAGPLPLTDLVGIVRTTTMGRFWAPPGVGSAASQSD
jgi:signal peptidase I